jgi:hypothetical protein
MWLLALAVAVAACSGGGGTDVPDDPGNGASSPEAAVSELLGHLKLGEFGEAVPLAIPGQAVLASLAEGATVEDVANGLRDGDELIVNNFWSGFAQTVEPFLIDTPELAGSEPVETQGVSFDVVTVRSTGGERTFTTRDVEGHRVDIFATFGPSLASRLYPAVERLLGSPEEDAIFVLGAMRDQVPSLHMAALTPGLAPNVVQDILQLIELVTRIS